MESLESCFNVNGYSDDGLEVTLQFRGEMREGEMFPYDFLDDVSVVSSYDFIIWS